MDDFIQQELAKGQQLRFLVRQLLNELPAKRDWLDPALERALKDTVQ